MLLLEEEQMADIAQAPNKHRLETTQIFPKNKQHFEEHVSSGEKRGFTRNYLPNFWKSTLR